MGHWFILELRIYCGSVFKSCQLQPAKSVVKEIMNCSWNNIVQCHWTSPILLILIGTSLWELRIQLWILIILRNVFWARQDKITSNTIVERHWRKKEETDLFKIIILTVQMGLEILRFVAAVHLKGIGVEERNWWRRL